MKVLKQSNPSFGANVFLVKGVKAENQAAKKKLDKLIEKVRKQPYDDMIMLSPHREIPGALTLRYFPPNTNKRLLKRVVPLNGITETVLDTFKEMRRGLNLKKNDGAVLKFLKKIFSGKK